MLLALRLSNNLVLILEAFATVIKNFLSDNNVNKIGKNLHPKHPRAVSRNKKFLTYATSFGRLNSASY
jgi:hypothetical protein